MTTVGLWTLPAERNRCKPTGVQREALRVHPSIQETRRPNGEGLELGPGPFTLETAAVDFIQGRKPAKGTCQPCSGACEVPKDRVGASGRELQTWVALKHLLRVKICLLVTGAAFGPVTAL